jgi:hypothetical protein
VIVADFNGDGKLDVAAANYDSGTVSVLLGKGDGTFRKARSFPAGGHPRWLALADFNRDGKLDLVVANRFQVGTLSVLLGKGDGSFASPVSYPVGSFPAAVAAGDFNGDGKVDLAVGNFGTSDVNVLLGNGDGTFRQAVNYPAGPGALLALAAADINGDGKLDLLTTAHNNDLHVLLGNGDGTFQRPVPNYGPGLYPGALALGRFTGGAQPDVVTANARSGNVTVLPNRLAAPYLIAVFALDTIDQDGMTCQLRLSACRAEEKAVNDTRYTGTVRLHSSDRRAVLPGEYAFVPSDKGYHPIRVKFRTPGSQTVTVTEVGGARLAASASIWVLRRADLRFRVDVPERVTAGKPFSVTVNVIEPFGDWTSGYGGTVRFRCTGAAAALPRDYTFDGVEERHTFTNAVTLPKPGKFTISATDTAIPGLRATATVMVRPAPRTTSGGD